MGYNSATHFTKFIHQLTATIFESLEYYALTGYGWTPNGCKTKKPRTGVSRTGPFVVCEFCENTNIFYPGKFILHMNGLFFEELP